MDEELDFEFHYLPAPPPRSTFVTVLAWIGIVLGGLATFISLLQNLMIYLLFPREDMRQAMQAAEQSRQFQQLPAAFGWQFNHFDLFFLGFLVAAAATLLFAIGLLKRKNWARLGFMILLGFGIAWNLGGLILQFSMYDAMPGITGQELPPGFATMMLVMKIASIAMVTACCGLFGWILYMLQSASIRAEFD